MTPESIHPWLEAEEQVRSRLAPLLEGHLLLAQDCERVAFDLLSAQRVQRPADVVRVHASLLARVLQDLRACVILAPSGYAMQTWSIAASCFEAAHAMGYVGHDIRRAERWLAHDKPSSFLGARAGIDATLKYLTFGNSQERAVLADQEYELYGFLCMAKHVNPLPERSRYVQRRGEHLRIVLSPTFSRSRARDVKLGLILAVRSTTTALLIFNKAHLGLDPPVGSDLANLLERTDGLLSEWNAERALIAKGNGEATSDAQGGA